MVRLYPAPPRGGPRGPLMMPRQRRPHEFIEPGFIPRYGMTRGYNFMRGPHMRPGLTRSRPPPPHLVPPPLPPRRLPLPPHQPLGLPPREIPGQHPLHLPGRRPGMPPPMPPMHPGLPHRGALRPGPPLGLIRGRGGLVRRGVAVKRLGSANLRVRPKRIQKRKERTEGDFYCETCDRSWKTVEKLEEHKSEHAVCGREGCTFTAHPKIVLKHAQTVHDTGLYHRIPFTENPDVVAKWIAERKSRYPTQKNVEKKEAQTSEMMKRGERIPKEGKRFQTSFPSSEDPNNGEGNVEVHLSDDDYNNEVTDTKTEAEEIKKPFVSNVLALLMTNYGSDLTEDDDDNDEHTVPHKMENPTSDFKKQDEVVQIKIIQSISDTIKVGDVKEGISTIHQLEEDSDDGPDECIIEREDKSNIPIPNLAKECKQKLEESKSTNFCNSKITKLTAPPVKQPMHRNQLSLLEKLLRNEIRQERNAILQCVRYVVRNNFFGCGNSSTQAAKSIDFSE